MPKPLAWIVCALGAFLVVLGYHQWRAGRETRSYTRTRGRVVGAEVEEIPRTSEEGGTRFLPVVRYAFEARGHTYASDRVSIGASTAPDTDAEAARRMVERYPPGSDVDVWFDPRDPRRSVLVPGIPTSQIVVALVTGIALLGIGMFVLAR